MWRRYQPPAHEHLRSKTAPAQYLTSRGTSATPDESVPTTAESRIRRPTTMPE